MTLWTRLLILTLLFGLGCETTPDMDDPIVEGEEVTISADDLEPLNRFFFETDRRLVADFIRIEMTPQFFEQKMGFTRDPRFVERTEERDRQGHRVLRLRNVNREQVTNINPNQLPRVYFGSGLKLIAYNEIRIYLVNPKDRARPLFCNIVGKSDPSDAKLWVSGRLQQERPMIQIAMDLLWSEQRERYLPKSHIG